MILGATSHIFIFEAGGCSAIAGVMPSCLQVQPDGTLKIEEIKAAVRKVDQHFPSTRLICLENTHNLCGGQTLPLEYINEVAEFAHNNNIKLHMDGARIFNAQAESGHSVAKICENVDSVTFCLSKGLCAPVGSVLCGTKEFILEAKRKRKMLGGGMRQVGMLAAAGLVALKKHPALLSQDHAVAQFLKEQIATIPGLKVLKGSTNFIFFEILGDAKVQTVEFAGLMKNKGILFASARGIPNAFRIVTHYWVTREKAEQVISALKELFC
jgi:threonine aldolase